MIAGFVVLAAIALNGATCLDRNAQKVPECVLVVRSGTSTPIDLHGRWIVLGFIDNHVHLGRVTPDSATWIRGGVTTVVDNGSNVPPAELSRRYTGGPRVDACGPIITKKGGYPAVGTTTAPALEVSGKEDAARATKELIERLHPACIKIAVERGFLSDLSDDGWPTLDGGEIAVIVRTAHEAGLRVRAHVTQRAEFDLAVQGGVDVIAHAPIQNLPEASMKRAARAGVVMVSTVALWSGDARAAAVRNVVRYAALGGPIAIGSDYPNWKDAGLPRTELQLLNDAGLTPKELLVALTRDTVNPNREPRDFVVLRSDPRQSVKAFSEIELVVRDGVVVFNARPECSACDRR